MSTVTKRGPGLLPSTVIVLTAAFLAEPLPALAHHGEAPAGPAVASYMVAFLFGLLGQANCFGMCGPLVALYAAPFDSRRRVSPARPHLAFNAGRIVCYSALGFLFGALKFLLATRFLLEGPIGLTVGLFVIVSGLHLLGRPAPGARVLRGFYRILTWIVLPYRRVARGRGAFALGLVHGFLPCSLLFIVLPLAAMMPDPLQSALFMTAFGVGTVPVMGGLGLALSRFRALTSRRILAASGIVVILWGAVLILRALDSLGLLGFHYVLPRVSFYRLEEFLGVSGR